MRARGRSNGYGEINHTTVPGILCTLNCSTQYYSWVLCELHSHCNTLYTIQSLHYYLQYTVTAQCTVIIYALLYKPLQYIRVHCPLLYCHFIQKKIDMLICSLELSDSWCEAEWLQGSHQWQCPGLILLSHPVALRGGGCLKGGSGERGGQSATHYIVTKFVVWDVNSRQETTAQIHSF